MEVDDASGPARACGVSAEAQERTDAAAVVRMPVREHDALDALDGYAQRGDVARDAARLGPRVEERVMRRGLAWRLGLLVCA